MKNGFILLYTVLILSVILITVSAFANSILKEVVATRENAESLKAFYAADAAIECVRFYQNDKGAFNTTSLRAPITCGGNTISVGMDPPTAQCVSHTYTFNMTGFSNGSCAAVTVNVIPRTLSINGTPFVICDLEVIASGRNTCAPGKKPLERTRWEMI